MAVGELSERGGDGVVDLCVGDLELPLTTFILPLPPAHDQTPDDTEEPPDKHSGSTPANKQIKHIKNKILTLSPK